MDAEYRRSKRQHIELEVCLVTSDGVFHDAATNNLSIEGMHISPSPLKIPPSQLVDVGLYLDKQPYWLRAMVVHSTQEGMGVMFNKPEPELYETAAYSAKVTPDHSLKS